MNEVREAIRQEGLGLGFAQVGFAPAERPLHADTYLRWLERGWHGDMSYMARDDAVERRMDPGAALAGCRTIIVVSLRYGPDADDAPIESAPSPPASQDPTTAGPASGAWTGASFLGPIIARYAAGRDYHDVFEERLAKLAARIETLAPGTRLKPYVDYGPVLERDHAQRAGLGWIGKNTVLIHPKLGSWLLLGELLTDLEVEPDEPFVPDHCGTCERCIVACPTDAIRGPRDLDARLCISYLTIELRGSIPEDLRPLIGRRVFGCDICQDVCPWNGDLAPADPDALAFGRPLAPKSMVDWARSVLAMTEEAFRREYGGTALDRPGRTGLLRNLSVGLGNAGRQLRKAQRAADRPLERAILEVLAALESDPAELVREHAAWGRRHIEETA